MLDLPEGWREHATAGFRLGLPERWEVVDVASEGIEAIWDMVEEINAEWAENITSAFSAEAMVDVLKFWAMDPEPAGVGFATVNVTHQVQPIRITAANLCAQMPALYEQMGIELMEATCDLRINGLDAVRFGLRIEAGPLAVGQYQFMFVQGRSVWAITIAVDATVWSEHQPQFLAIGETFMVD